MDEIFPGVSQSVKDIRSVLGDWADRHSGIAGFEIIVGEVDQIYTEFYDLLSRVNYIACEVEGIQAREQSGPISS